MLLIKKARLIDPESETDRIADILTDGEIIGLIRENIDEKALSEYAERSGSPECSPEDITVIDARGLICAPGLVDTHSHFRDPGFPHKEDITSGSLAAAKGGYTTIVMMANTNPPIDNETILRDVLERGRKEPVHIYSAANVTKGMSGREVSDLEELAAAGALVFTDDGRPVLDGDILEQALVRASALGIPVSLHEEDPRYICENGINGAGNDASLSNEGTAAAYFGLKGSARTAEISMIERDLNIAVKTGAALLIQHISTAEGVDLVRKAKRLNPLIAAEATPHHFSLTEEAVKRKGSLAKVNPPIRTERDRQAIIEGLCDGTIGIIATDHAPHAAFEKEMPLVKAPSGMTGLETSLSLGIKNLVQPGYLSMKEYLRCLTSAPAKYYGLPAGSAAEGSRADLVLFDPEAQWTVTENFASRSSNSPFIGETLPGVVRYTIADGKIIYSGI